MGELSSELTRGGGRGKLADLPSLKIISMLQLPRLQNCTLTVQNRQPHTNRHKQFKISIGNHTVSSLIWN